MSTRTSDPEARAPRRHWKWVARIMAVLLVASGLTIVSQPEPAQASIVTRGSTTQDCAGNITGSATLVGVSIGGYTLRAYVGRTVEEMRSGQYVLAESKPETIFDWITQSVSGTWKSPWPGQPVVVGYYPDSFPWGSFAINLANEIHLPAPTGCLVSVGDYVWTDSDGNGVQDAGESPLGNVTVQLRNGSGTYLRETRTNAQGFYSFTGLTANANYQVRFLAPDGYALTQQEAGGDRARDSNPDQSGVASFTAPGYGQNSATSPDLPTIDAGVVPKIDLALAKTLVGQSPFDAGSTVTFTLTPKNHGPGTARAGWSVTEVLPAELTLQSMTGAGYSCSGNVCSSASALAPGASGAPITVTAKIGANVQGEIRNVAYVSPAPNEVPETNPLGTPPGPGTVTQDTPTNNDADAPLTVRSKVSVGDTVWFDADRDGVQDAGETPIADVTVKLLNAAGTQVQATTTNADGFYSFTNLDRGTRYTVEFVAPAGYSFTQQGAGSDRAKDSNPGTDGKASVTTPASGSNSATTPDDPTIDAGLVRNLVSIGDTVWFDKDRDGVQDAGETPIADVTVRLLDAAGTQVRTTTTNADGFYSFTGLDGAGKYTVEFVAPAGYSFTQQGAGADRTKDSNPGADGKAPVTTPASGSNSATSPDDPTIDAGLVRNLVSIGDTVWFDKDRDGVQDAGETPIADVTVKLLNAAGTQVRTTTTNADGFYSFAGLDGAGKYTVEFVAPAGYSFTQQGAGADRTKDSNPGADGKASVTTPASGSNSATSPDDPTIDAGLVRNLVSIGDFVWFDADNDGAQDPDERPAPGVTVKLLDAAGTQVRTTTTNADGFYSFTDLDGAGRYTVEFVAPEGYSFTQQSIFVSRDQDSNPDTDGRAPVTTPASGSNSATTPDDPTIDAGLVRNLVSIGDFVWFDADRDGVQDAGEDPIADVTVRLLDEAGALVQTTTTDADGRYAFAHLPAGARYTVEFAAPSGYSFTRQGAGSDRAKDSNPSADGKASVTTPASGSNSATSPDDPTIDAGLVRNLVSIGDFVWFDADRDGIQDAGEPPASAVRVRLLDASGAEVQSTMTNAQGFYSFADLSGATRYTVEFAAPSGYSFTRQGAGADRAKDSNPGADGKASVTTPASGSNSATSPDDPTIDAGLVRNLVSIGDTVWFDADRDGIQDAGEPPASAVRVRLLDASGAEAKSTMTNAQGFYSFADLSGATPYTVEFASPSGYSFTRQGAGADRAKDSNPGADGKASVTTPASGSNSATSPDDPTIDAGLVRNLVSIGDTVWFDADRDGIQDAGEPPAEDITVNLLDDSGAQVRTTTTNSDGFYSFTDLDGAGKYTVEFEAPEGYALTTRTVGDDRATDSNPGSDGKAPVTAPPSGSNSATAPDDPTIDAGLIPALGTLSWKKTDPQGAALRGSEWTLTAQQATGVPAGTAIAIVDCVAAAASECTGEDRDPRAGWFAVSGLAHGTYELVETKAPAGYRLLEDPIAVTIGSATTVLSDIENHLQEVPAIPLTGGLGADGYRIAGAMLLLLMLGLGTGELVRRRRTSA